MTDADRLFSGDDGPTTSANFPGDVEGDGDRKRSRGSPLPPTPGLGQLIGPVTREDKIAFGTGGGPALAGLVALPFAPLLGVIALTVAATLTVGAAYQRRKESSLRSRSATFYLAGLSTGTVAGLLALGLLSALTAIAGVAA